MSDTYQPGQAVYVSATFVKSTPSGNALISVNGRDIIVAAMFVSAAPSPQQIEDLREAIDQIAPTGPDGSP